MLKKVKRNSWILNCTQITQRSNRLFHVARSTHTASYSWMFIHDLLANPSDRRTNRPRLRLSKVRGGSNNNAALWKRVAVTTASVSKTIRKPPLALKPKLHQENKKNTAKNDFQDGGWNSLTLQCDTWLWDDIPLNSPKRPPYWNSTTGFNFDHIKPVCEILSKSDCPQQKYDVMSIFKMADIRHLEFYGSNNGFLEKPMYDFLQVVNRDHSYKLVSYWENRVFAFWRQTD